MTDRGRRILSHVVTFIVGAVFSAGLIAWNMPGVSELSHWPLKNLQARLAPLFWPNEPFDQTTWLTGSPELRYRMVNELLGSDQLQDRTAAEVADVLGCPATDLFSFKVKYHDNNLWYALVVECPGRMHCEPRVGMAYFDP